jgi:hypothetical protein
VIVVVMAIVNATEEEVDQVDAIAATVETETIALVLAEIAAIVVIEKIRVIVILERSRSLVLSNAKSLSVTCQMPPPIEI